MARAWPVGATRVVRSGDLHDRRTDGPLMRQRAAVPSQRLLGGWVPHQRAGDFLNIRRVRLEPGQEVHEGIERHTRIPASRVLQRHQRPVAASTLDPPGVAVPLATTGTRNHLAPARRLNANGCGSRSRISVLLHVYRHGRRGSGQSSPRRVPRCVFLRDHLLCRAKQFGASTARHGLGSAPKLQAAGHPVRLAGPQRHEFRLCC